VALVGSALVRDPGHVFDGDAPLGACALYLRDVHPQLLGLLPGGLRSVGLLLSGLLLLAASGLLGGPTHSVLRTLGSLACSVAWPAACCDYWSTWFTASVSPKSSAD
jgi:hypothetical protein